MNEAEGKFNVSSTYFYMVILVPIKDVYSSSLSIITKYNRPLRELNPGVKINP